MHIHDVGHRVFIRESNVVKETAAQKSVRQFFFVVGGNQNNRPMTRLNGFVRFVNIELHAVQFTEQIVGKLDISFINLVDQQNGLFITVKAFPQGPLNNVIRDVLNLLITQLRVTQSRYRIVLIQTLLCLTGGLDMPFKKRLAQGMSHLFGQTGFTGTRLTLNQQWSFQSCSGIHRHFQIIGCDVIFCAFKAHDLPTIESMG